MFTRSAELYDLIYSFKDYKGEASKIRDLIRSEHPQARTILDVACGTGEHARLLADDFSVDGIDLDSNLVTIARGKGPSGQFFVGNMCSFELQEKYDVVQCLFSSIGYLTKPEDVVSALRCFAKHLNPGGVIIVEPWLTPECYTAGIPHMAPPIDRPDIKIARMNVSEREGNLSRLRFHYLLARSQGVEYFQEDHELALYSVQEMLRFFREAGLKATHDPEGIFGRGMYIARADTREDI
jgi:ubiquinone/menaquinone biosynthesis C-methylase UbiE